MVEEATQDFVDFVQHHCNTNGSSGDGNSNSVLRHLAIIAAPHMAMFRSEGDTVNLAHVAANMLIGSSIESLHLSNKDWNPNLDEIFHRAMGVAHLIDVVDELSIAGAHALLEYLPQSAHLRNLTVSRMDRNVDSSQVAASLRRNGSLYNVVMTKGPAVSYGEPLLPFFTPEELRRVEAYGLRNQTVPRLLAVPPPRSFDDRHNDTSNNLHLYSRLFVATRPTARTAPNNLVTGLLSGDEALGM